MQAILQSPVLPAAIELVDGACVEAIERAGAGPVPFTAPFLLVEVDGREAVVDDEAKILGDLLTEAGAEVRVAANEEESRALWDGRRAISEGLREAAPAKTSEDAAVPIARLVELLDGVARLAEPLRLTHVSYGHAGDGNIHVNVLYDPAEGPISERVERFRSGLFDLVLALGGTISGEHGVGISKRPFIARELSPDSMALQRAIKSRLRS
ncbi:MAG: hypothetical protein M5R36_13275 [Deltaproteobacteria bacterium]|nr:hypothetical protein [Deltaproteobacteria bacterium]